MSRSSAPRPSLLAAFALVSSAAVAASQNVVPPPLWYSGDTHEMIQLCADSTGQLPPDRTLSDVYAEMLAKDLNVADVLVYVSGNTTCQGFLSTYVPMVTGLEDPLTLPDPDFVLQFGCEVVGGADPACAYPAWGHVVGIGIEDAGYDFDADYPAPHLAFFRAQPKGLTGYAHVAWPEGISVPQDFPPIDRDMTRLHPLLAPTDIAMHRVDFLATPDVGHLATEITPYPWWGLWYKLLDAGLRVSLTGGTVAQCYVALGTLDARTYSRIALETLDHDKWLRGIERGRTSIADGSQDFLDLQVQGLGIGSTLQLAAPGNVTVKATLITTAPRQTTIELLLDGEVVASQPVNLPAGGQHAFQRALSVTQSTWISARTLPKAHTGAVYVIVDKKPIVDFATANYFVAFANQLDVFLDDAIALCQACAGQPCGACDELEAWVGTSEAQIRADITAGRKIFRAMRDYDRPPPGDAQRYGRSTPSCHGPLGIGLAAPLQPGTNATLTCFNAPQNTTGALVVGQGPLVNGVPYNGATLHVSQVPPPLVLPATTDEGGYAEMTVQIPPTSTTFDLYCQFLFSNTTDCPASGTYCASDALRVSVPRNFYSPSPPPR